MSTSGELGEEPQIRIERELTSGWTMRAGKALAFPSLCRVNSVLSGIMGAATLLHPVLCCDFMGYRSRWVPTLESTSGRSTLRNLGLQTLGVSSLLCVMSSQIEGPQRVNASRIMMLLNTADAVLAGFMWRDGLLSPLGFVVHAGLGLGLAVAFLPHALDTPFWKTGRPTRGLFRE